MNDTVQNDRLNTLDALVQLANLKHLPGPSAIRMQPGILVLTLASHDDAIAWCEEFGAEWNLNDLANEIFNTHNVTWRGWTLQIHSHTEES